MDAGSDAAASEAIVPTNIFAHSRVAGVKNPAGEEWTVAIAPGYQWQGWDWFDRAGDTIAAADRGSSGTPIVFLVLLPMFLLMLVPRLCRWIAYRARGRSDWFLTVRPGIKSGSAIGRGAVFSAEFENLKRAREAAEQIRNEIRNGRELPREES